MRVRPQGVFFGAVVAALALLVLLPNAPIGRVPSEDEGVFLYAARTISSGGMPYRDLWDHKPPGTYLVDALVGGGPWGVFGAQVLALVGAALLSYRALLAGGLGSLGAILGTIAWIFAAPRLFLAEDGLQTNYAELYALPLQFAALDLFAREEKRPTLSWRTEVIGVLGAVAVLLKPTLVGIWIAVALLLIVTRAASRRWADLALRVAVLSVSVAAVLGLVAVWLATGGALDDAIDQVIRYNALYSGFATPLDRLEAVALGIRLTLPTGFAILAGAGAALALRGPRPLLVTLALVALPLELALSSAGRAYHYYFLSWLPVMAVLAGYAGARAHERMGWRLARRALVGVAVVMAIAPGILVGRLIRATDDGSSREAAAFIRAATRPDQRVLIWGSRAEVLVLADRRSAGRFVYQYAALATRGYATPARIEELIAQLERERPLLIVDASSASFVTPPLDRSGFVAWTSPEPQYAWPPETSRILDFVAANYERTTLAQSGWPVWRLRAP